MTEHIHDRISGSEHKGRREEILCGFFRWMVRIPCFAVLHRRREASLACGK